MDSCIFCKMVKKEIPTKVVYEDDMVFAFEDINPVSPVHVLIVPKKHVTSLLEISKLPSGNVEKIMESAVKIAENQGLAEKGFRLVCNCGSDGGQSVGHLHYHLMGGRSFNWPPG